MSAWRESVLREAQHTAAMLRRAGYPEAAVAPEYCIEGEIGPDGFYTRTVSVYAGPYRPETLPTTIRNALKAALGRARI